MLRVSVFVLSRGPAPTDDEMRGALPRTVERDVPNSNTLNPRSVGYRLPDRSKAVSPKLRVPAPRNVV